MGTSRANVCKYIVVHPWYIVVYPWIILGKSNFSEGRKESQGTHFN